MAHLEQRANTISDSPANQFNPTGELLYLHFRESVNTSQNENAPQTTAGERQREANTIHDSTRDMDIHTKR